MKVKVCPMKEVHIFGLDERSLNNLAWCAMAYRVDRLFWSDGCTSSAWNPVRRPWSTKKIEAFFL